METLNNYILEKLKINKNTKLNIISISTDAINKTCEYYNLQKQNYNIYLLDGSDSRGIVNDQKDCHAVSISFKKSTIEDIEKSKPFSKFIKQFKDKLESFLSDKPVEVKIVQNRLSSIEKIHVILL